MKRIVALLGLIWALANLLAAYLLVTNAFTAKTPQKEGVLVQILLWLGGIALAVFGLALAWSTVRLARSPADELA